MHRSHVYVYSGEVRQDLVLAACEPLEGGIEHEIHPDRLLGWHLSSDERRGPWYHGCKPRRGHGHPVRQGPIGYTNNIYDNAQAEMETDNMEQMIALDYHKLRPCMVCSVCQLYGGGLAGPVGG